MLPDEMLLEIFAYLDERDLVVCELVHSSWRRVLSAGGLWRRLHRRKVATNQLWRQTWKFLGKKQSDADAANWKDVFKRISLKIKELEHNWRTGNFDRVVTTISVNPYRTKSVVMDERFIVLLNGEMKPPLLVHRETMQVEMAKDVTTEGPKHFSCMFFHDNLVFCGVIGRVLVFDLLTGKQVFNVATPHCSPVRKILVTPCGLMATATVMPCHHFNVALWSVSRTSIELKHDVVYPGAAIHFFADDGNVAVYIKDWMDRKQMHIYSIQTFGLEKSYKLTSDYRLAYGKGMVVVMNRYVIRFVDVKTGANYRQIGSKIVHIGNRVEMNCSVVAIGGSNDDKGTVINLYDLRAIKGRDKKADIFLTCVKLNFYSAYFLMDERQIVCFGQFHEDRNAVIELNFLK